MKHDAKSRCCRLDLSVAELDALVHLASTGSVPAPAAGLVQSIITGLKLALVAQQNVASAQRSAAATRRARAAGPDKRWTRHLIVDGHNVTAERSDYVNVGTMDYDHWRDLKFLEAMRQEPAQAEVRRDVWLVRVSTTDEQRQVHDRMFVGTDLTATNDPNEIEPLARKLIEADA